MTKHTKLMLIIVLLGVFVFGQGLAVLAQVEPTEPIIVVATAVAPTGEQRDQDTPLEGPDQGIGVPIMPPTLTEPIGDASLKSVEDAFLISWSTTQPSTGWLLYGSAPDVLNNRVPSGDALFVLSTTHAVTMPLPASDAPLYFVIISNGVRYDDESWPFKVYADTASMAMSATPLISGPNTKLSGAPAFGLGGPTVGPEPIVTAPSPSVGQPAAPVACPPANCTPGKDVSREFFVQVVQRLKDVTYNDFAVAALQAWKPYENTSACWNPLATTWKMSEICNFNSVGVQHYQSQDMGTQATANTLNLAYYDAIRRMLRREAFDREAIRGSLSTWGTCGGATCDSLLNTWQDLYNSYSGDPDDNRTISNGQTLNGTISPDNDEDVYYFDAAANSRATIHMTRISGSLDSFLELYDPSGTLIAVDDDSGDGTNSLIENRELSAGGRYKIIARSWSRSSSGSYELRLGLSGSITCPDGQYRAEYYNNRSLSGSPTFTRCESSINNDWGSGGPGNGVGNDNFSVRWTGHHNFGGGNMRFIARADDGIKVYLDGSVIIDGWRDQAPTEYRAERSPSAGLHEVKVEYYENGGGAVAQVRWEAGGCSDGQYRAEYYNNRSLSGSPTFTRCESSINNDWGSGGPGNGVGNDNFSVRWTGHHNFGGGNMRFIARADDGIKVYLDGSVIIDGWRDQAPTEYRAERSPSAGLHEVKVEYYENGGGAVAQVRWEAGGCSGQYFAEYFNNRTLSGSPVLTRCENWPINWDWGSGSPGGGVTSDSFSARWTGQASIDQGTYTFIARADDGIKVYLDGAVIIDGWRDQAPTEYRVTRSVNSGNHAIKVEYYENGGGAVAQFRWERASDSGNVALNRPTAATSQESSTYSPSKGNDGSNSTRWSSALSSTLGPQMWVVDLGSAHTINRVRINWETAYAASYRLIWSDDGSNWYYYSSNQYTRSGSGWGENTFTAWSHRYIGIQMLTRAPQMNNYSFFEYEAYGPSLTGVLESMEGMPLEVEPGVLEPVFPPPERE